MAPTQQLVPGRSQNEDMIFQLLKKLVLESLSSEDSRASYSLSIDVFLTWFTKTWRGALNKMCVHAFRQWLIDRGYSASTINTRLAAVRRLAYEASDNGFVPGAVAAAIGRVKRVPASGTRTGFWLDKEGAIKLLQTANTATVLGIRNHAVLCVMVGCGLRREEVIGLELRHIGQREGRWCILNLIGKGGKVRTVPMPEWVKTALDAWLEAAGPKLRGRIFRRVWKGCGQQRIGKPLSHQTIWNIVREAGLDLDLELRPHDLRRTFAKLAYKGDAPLDQIQLSLGHSHLKTTEIYLGIDQDLQDAPADRLGISKEDLKPQPGPRPKPVKSKSRDATLKIPPVSVAEAVARLTPEERADLENLRRAIHVVDDQRAALRAEQENGD